MFGFLKKILTGRSAARAAAQGGEEQNSTAQPGPNSSQTNGHNGHGHPGSNGHHNGNGNGTMTGNGLSQNGSGNGEKARRSLQVSVRSIVNLLPADLVQRVREANVGETTITVGMDKVLSQLSRGVVKISFGELRKLAPEAFSAAADRDKVLVPLPLDEIVRQLNPTTIARKIGQKHIEVPAEISSPFDPANKGAICAVTSAKPYQAAAIIPQAPAPVAAPEPVVEAAAVEVAVPAPKAPEPKAPAPIPMSPVSRGALTSSPTPPPPSTPMPTVQASVAATRQIKDLTAPKPLAPLPPLTLKLQTEPVAPASSATPAAPAPAPEPEVPPIVTKLAGMAEGWPEAIRKDLFEMSLVDAVVALPATVVEQGLKQGRLAFSWKTLRSWIKPAPLPAVSAHDNVLVELPLKIIAPLFLGRQKPATADKPQVSVDRDIPNLFFGFPQPDQAVPAAAPKPADTNYYNYDINGNLLVDPGEEKAPTPGTQFLSRYATPNEVVARASALPGVAGSLITLPDGLMVASSLAPDLNGDTLAAFLPQIFGKVSQCTKELRMGVLNNLNFTVGNVPWKIFRVNAIFFAAFGKVGEALPTAQLAALAAELDHKPK
jgi:predicted regulator of Ras-like GTPase activity (Roadblock/LC7/MglB family)